MVGKLMMLEEEGKDGKDDERKKIIKDSEENQKGKRMGWKGGTGERERRKYKARRKNKMEEKRVRKIYYTERKDKGKAAYGI